MTIHPVPGYNAIWRIHLRIDSAIMFWAVVRSHRVWLIVSGKLETVVGGSALPWR
jgi:hypothetical protein